MSCRSNMLPEHWEARAEASRLGAKRFLGPPCAYGHSGLRYVAGNMPCVDCTADRTRLRRGTQTVAQVHHAALALPVATEFIKPPTRAMLMAGRVGSTPSPKGR